jgi:hypothetical protein
MAITAGQKSTYALVGSGASVTTSWAVNPLAGSTILVFVQLATTPPTTVADNGATPSTFILDKSSTAGKGAYIYRANNIVLPASGLYAVTASGISAATYQAWGREYGNVKPGAPTATNVGGATSAAVSTGSAGPAAAGGLVFGGFSDASGLAPETITFTGSAPLTEQARATGTSGSWPMAVCDGLTDVALAATWTLGDSVAWGAAIAAYDAVSAGPVSKTQRVRRVQGNPGAIPSQLQTVDLIGARYGR